MPETNTAVDRKEFRQRVWIAGGILSLLVVLILLLKTTFSVLLLILGGVLIAVFFWGLSGLIRKKTNWNSTLSLVISVLGTFILIGLLFWLIGSKVQTQVEQLSNTLPNSIQNARQELNKTTLGQKLVKQVTSEESQSKLKSVASTFFKSTFGVLGDIYIILILGIYFTVSPGVYKKGIVSLVPVRGRDKANEVLKALGENLKKWLKGKVFAMFVVFVLTAIGLVIIGMPMWLVLAIIAGILNFIPNFGPIIAMIPAVLVALMQGPVTAGLVAGLYILVQVLESNLITPQIQKKLVSIPPALIIIAQLIMGALSGGWGLVLATPLMLILIVVVRHLYIQPMEKKQDD